MANAKILVIQDDHAGAADLEERLNGLGYTVCASVSSGQRACEKAAEMRPDLALIDLGLKGDVNGAEVGERIGSRFDIPVIYLTDDVEGSLLQRAEATNPFGYVLKPFEERQLHLNIKAALSLYQKERRHKETEHRLERTVTQLQEQSHLLETVFNCISDGVIVADENENYLMFNPSAQRIAGVSTPDPKLEQRPKTYGLFLPDGVTPFPVDELPLTRAVRGESTDKIELFIRNPHRPEGLYILASGRPLRDDSGKMKGGVVVFHDVTDLKATESLLKHTAERLRVQTRDMEIIFNSISDGVVAADAQGKFTLFNPSAERIVGIGMLDVPPDQWTDRYGIFYLDKATHFPFDQLPLIRALRGERTDEIEMFIRNEKKPQGVYISVSGRPLQKKEEKGYGGGVIVFRDVTRHKMAEAKLEQTMQELRNQSELMETTFKSISDGIVVADAKGKFLYVNPGAEQIVGMGATDTSPDEWSEKYGTFYPDRQTPAKTEDLPLIRAIFGGESTDEETLFIRNAKRPDGVYIRVSGRPLLNEVGGVRGGVIIFRDATEQILAEETLVRAFTQGRLEIVDTILHNIGNAINSVIIGAETVHQHLTNNQLVGRLRALADAIKAHRDDWSDYIKHDSQGRKVMPFILALAEDFAKQNTQVTETIHRVRDRATHIADIVRTQKALGSQTHDRKDLNLQHAFSEAIRVLEDSLEKRRIRIDIDCQNAPQEIRIQESQFQQMMINLIKNAIEAIDELATSSGLQEQPRIQVRACVEGQFLNIDVSDNGIGIATKNAKILFAPGYTTKKSGSGFGLHSISNFVVGSGGQIHALSDGIGQGATMRVVLRLSSVTPPLKS